jgi:hypothetical protein
MTALIAAGETDESVDGRGDLLSGRNGNDFVYGSNRTPFSAELRNISYRSKVISFKS